MEPVPTIAVHCDPGSLNSEVLRFAAGYSTQARLSVTLLVPDTSTTTDDEIKSIFGNTIDQQTSGPVNVVRISDSLDSLPESVRGILPFRCLVIDANETIDFETIAGATRDSRAFVRLADQVIRVPSRLSKSRTGIRHLVVPIDDDSESEILLSAAQEWASRLECDVAIIHAVGMLAAVSPHPLPMPSYALDSVVSGIAENLYCQATPLRNSGIDVSIIVDFGDLRSVVERSGIDTTAALAICGPGHNRNKWWFIDRSVRRMFLKHLSIPVLSVNDSTLRS